MTSSSSARSNILAQALNLADLGLPCFPCASDKKPTTPHGFNDATCARGALVAMWGMHPGPLIGVRTGAASGLDVLDIDVRHRGGEWYGAHRQILPPTRVHRTRSGGLHLLFQHRHGLRCSSGRIASGVDVRADGGYVIWWPAAGFPVLSDQHPARWPAGWM